MTPPAVRSRLLQLRRDLDAAREGRQLLDRKREAIVRALADHLSRRAARTAMARRALGTARASLALAQDEHGRAAVSAAAIAQPVLGRCARDTVSIAGVRVPTLSLPHAAFIPHYGPASGSPALDRAGGAFADAVETLAGLASEDVAVRRLRAALARTARRLNALDHIVLPRIARDIRAITSALEEDERDEATRRRISNVHVPFGDDADGQPPESGTPTAVAPPTPS
jgi:V/A-type H+/Na+-transporting ATPase subunit D